MSTLDFDPDKTVFPNGHFTGGVLLNDEGDVLEVRRPSDARVYAEVPIAAAAIVDRAVNNAQAAFQTSDWATGAPCTRPDTAALGRPDRHRERRARSDRSLGVDAARQAGPGRGRPLLKRLPEIHCRSADKLGGDVAATRIDHLGLVIGKPYGVVATIAPWNFPITQAVTKIGPALAAGNDFPN
ncbi:aldehyde dehydrogenase family protein [Variovorax sp. CF079]|uniref:aldehyde dehydrogenase family protein n=1 Tax=Variovorax sp. CF079 TaxID=1882774 RepID=UPI00244E9BA7|nr:aldehyde dehydrogenase family protein [Variovorax sp. CF079]